MQITVDTARGNYFVVDATLNDIALSKTRNDLVLTFVDGSSKTIQDFYSDYTKQNLPDFLMQGVRIEGSAFFEKFGKDVQPDARFNQGGSPTAFTTPIIDVPDIAEGVAMSEQEMRDETQFEQGAVGSSEAVGMAELMRTQEEVTKQIAEEALAEQESTPSRDIYGLAYTKVKGGDPNIEAALFTNARILESAMDPSSSPAPFSSSLDDKIIMMGMVPSLQSAKVQEREILESRSAIIEADSGADTDIFIYKPRTKEHMVKLDVDDTSIEPIDALAIPKESLAQAPKAQVLDKATPDSQDNSPKDTADGKENNILSDRITLPDSTAQQQTDDIEHLQQSEAAIRQINLDFSNGELLSITGSFADGENTNIVFQGMVAGAVVEQVVDFGAFNGDQMAFDCMLVSLKEEFNLA